MSESKHTPGPWMVVGNEDEHGDMRTYIGTLDYKFPQFHCVKHVAKIMGWGYDYDNDPEQQANARLIAAAPEMYRLLEGLHLLGDREDIADEWGEVFDAVRDVLDRVERKP